MRKKKPLPPQEELLRLFDYNPETGALTWQPVTRDRGRITRRAGKLAFRTNKNGYLAGKIYGSTYFAHRVIWKMVHGIDPIDIDHLNHIQTDNRLSNLRSVTAALNNRNIRPRPDSASGCVGVYRSHNGKAWRVSMCGGESRVNLGYFRSLEEAVAVRKAAEVIHGFITS